MRSGFLAAAGLAAAVVAQAPGYGVVDEMIGGDAPYSLVADLDGDLDFDLLGGDVSLSALDDGTGRFVPGWPAAPSFPAPNPRLADLDGDGIKDLLYGAGSSVFWRRGVPGGFHAAATPLPVPTFLFSALRAGVGDIDADGDLDVLIVSPPTLVNQVRLFVNDGVGVFADATAATAVAATAFNGGKLVDLDGDGLSDVLAWNRAPSAPVHVQRNLGGTFAPLQALPVSGLTSAGAIDGDFDADGLVDVIVSGAPEDPIQFFRQTAPFVFG
ncbi:MAG TPA: VCBS repeat-containing protein, partial [Planctomycetota bacterium]|nr:VCBS repeat-containing protein [Planctomycetota bacterium]